MDKISSDDLSQQRFKDELAGKISYGKKLNNSEKEFICSLLTGKKPRCKKRGRPSTKVRDYHLAIEYLRMMADNPNKSHIYRDQLKKEYWKSTILLEDNSFYAALGRGMKILQLRAENWIEMANSNIAIDISDEEEQKLTSSALERLKLIDDHRRRNEHLNKYAGIKSLQ